MAFDTTAPQMLTAAEIWEIDDTPQRTIEIPEWNNRSVRVRGLTLEQIATVAEKATRRNTRTGLDEVDRGLLAAYTVILGMVEPKLELADIGRIRQRSATAITRIVQAVSSLGATDEAILEADKSIGNGLPTAISVFPSSPARGDDAERNGEAHVGA